MTDHSEAKNQRNDILEGEDALVLAAQANPKVFGRLFEFYAPRVYRYVLHRLGDVDDAEDVTSRIFADALQSINCYRPRHNGSFGGWLFTIARRRCTDFFRVHDPVAPSSNNPGENPTSLLDAAISHDERERLREILASLDKSELELLRLRFAADLSYKQIGDAIGKTEAAAKMSIVRLIQRLRSVWEAKDE